MADGWSLLPQHRALVRASAISETVVAARGYRSVMSKAELLDLGFSANQARSPALLIPIWNVHGELAFHQIRPDEPRVDSGGKTIKYETPVGSRAALDVHPLARPRLGDPTVPLWITEGIRKADAAVAADLCCIALLGVWNWRGANEVGGTTALADWESIALNGRDVLVAFDSDVMTKPAVQQALARLKAFLESRHARVSAIYLPSGPDGAKVGLDDYFAAGHTTGDLLALATTELRMPTAAMLSARTSVPRREEWTAPFRTAREIGEAVPERIDWLVPGYVAAGAVTELVGKVKAAGKTTWLTHAVSAVVSGTPFMDRPTIQTGVVYLTEQSPTTFRVALARAGLLDRDDVVVLFWRDIAGASWVNVVAAAVAECQARGFGLLIVDTLPRFAGLRGDAENNAGDADEAMAPLMRAAADGMAVIVVRHERKAGGEVGVSGRGSSAFGGAVDIVLALKRGEGATRPTVRVLLALSRFDETPDELVVELQDGGYVALGDQAAVASADARSRLLAELPTSPDDALSMDEIKARLHDISPTTIERARDALRAEGAIQRCGAGKKGDPYRYWVPRRDDDGMIDSAPPADEFGQNEIDVEEDYPQSAWDPQAGEGGSPMEQGVVAPFVERKAQ